MPQLYSLIPRVLLSSLLFAPTGVTLAQAPLVTAVAPLTNASAAAPSSPVSFTFNQALTAGSAAALKVYSSQRGGLRTRAATPATLSGNTLSFVPTAYPFRPGETVRFTLTTAAASSSGSLAQPRVGQFTTAVGGTGRGVFTGGSDPAVGSYPTAVATGDLDGDGDQDLIVSNYGSGVSASTVSVCMNGGAGTFSVSQTLTVGISSSDVVLDDLDGDGDLDLLAVSYANNYVSVRLNGGTGVFSGTQNVAVGTGPNGLATGDVDGDGDLDMVATNSGNNTVSVRLNGGNALGSNTGVFSGTQNVSVGDYPNSVVLGDVDGDGDLDMVNTNFGGSSLSVRLNGGNGTGSNTGIFSGGSSVAVGSRPKSVVLGDVDGDGDLDLLVANSNGTTVSVRLNAGNGAFSSGQDVTVGTDPNAVVLGDVDGDGDLDFVSTTSDYNTVSLRLNGGNGVFSGGSDLPYTSPAGVALADVDGDADLDLITTAYSISGAVNVRLNRPSGPPTLTGFSPSGGVVGTAVTLTGTNLSGATSVSFNGAVQPLITNNTATSLTVVVPATGAATGPLTVVTPNGSASSSASFAVVPALAGTNPTSGAAGSYVVLNGTGLKGTSTVTFSGTGSTTVTTGFVVNAAGTQVTGVLVPSGAATGPVTVTTPGGTSTGAVFTVTVPVPTLTAIFPASSPIGATIALIGTGLTGASAVTFAGTSNNTATTGIVVSATASELTVAVPGGATTGPVTVTTPGGTSNAVNFTLTNELIITGLSPRANGRNAVVTAPVAATFNYPISAASANALKVFGSQSKGLLTRTTPATVSSNVLAYTPVTPFRPGEAVQYTITTAVGSSSAPPLLRPKVVQFTTAAGGTGRGIFTGQQRVSGGTQPYGVATGDVDGDGDLDFLCGGYSSGGGVALYLNGGDATGSNTGVFSISGGANTGAFAQSIALGDVDGDGDLDLLAASFMNTTGSTPVSSVSVRLNGGNATGSNTGVFSGGSDVVVNDGPLSIALGDVDGDGDLDFVTSSLGVGSNNGNGSTVSVRFNNGAGAFSGTQTVAVGRGPKGVALGDVDADGDLDLLTANYTAGTVSVRINDGTGAFSGGSDPAVDSHPSSIALGDVDGDGDLDFVTANDNATGSVSVRLNGGSGLFSGGSDPSVYSGPINVALGDVDADGDLDLLTANYGAMGGSTVSVRLNSGAGVFSGGSNPTVGDASCSPTAVALGDFDGDGDLDFVASTRFGSEIGVRMNRSPSEPTILSFTPMSGLVGSSVTLTGTNLGGATSVRFNGAAQSVITNNTSTNLTVAVPAGATTGFLSVTTPGGTGVSTLPFTVIPTPVLTSISPASGAVGSTVTLNGIGLQGVFGITFAGTSNNSVNSGFVANAAGTQITGVVVPNGAITGNVTATGPRTTSNGVLFTVTTAQLAVSQNGTPYPSGGATAYAFGSQLVNTTSTASSFLLTNTGTAPLTLSGVSTTGDFAVSGTAPTTVLAGATAAVAVTFTPVAGGNHTGTLRLTSPQGLYVVNLTGTGTYPQPVINGISPSGGATAGTLVTVTGTGFVVGSTTVTLNGVVLSGVVVSATSLTFTIPVGALSGNVVVTTPGGSGTIPFCVLYTPSVTPASRCGTGSLTLTASGAPTGASSYAWYSSAASSLPLATGPSYVIATLSATTTYYVAIGSGACEGNRVPVTATVNPAPTMAVAAAGALTFCQGGSVVLTASGASTYQWNTGQTTTSIRVTASGSYTVTGTTAAGCAASSSATTVAVEPLPMQPSVSMTTGTLTSSSPTGNQWYFNGVAIPGANGATYVANSNGVYTVVVTSPLGCVSPASTPQSVVVTATQTPSATLVTIFPNPARQFCTVQVPGMEASTGAELTLVNALGQAVRHEKLLRLPTRVDLDLRGLATGLYLVRLQAGETTLTKALVVE